MFRNVRFYRWQGPWPDAEDKLSENLAKAAFTPCGPLTERSSGWEPVAHDQSPLLARRVNGADLVKLRSQSRVLPHAAVNEELEHRVEAYRERMQELPSTREKRRLKNEARDELMPKALLKSDRIWGYADPGEQIVAIDTAQEANAERFLRRLTAAIDGLSVSPLQYREPVDPVLAKVFFGDAPKQFALGRECRMQDLSDSRSIARWTDFDLSDPSIRKHVSDGMRLTHLALEYDNVMSCVLDENGTVSKLKLLGMDEDSDESHDPLARLDAEFVLLTGTLRHFIKDLKKLLGGFA
ncbi:MAG: recombination-associated protein RdgC [Pseudomonadota bacterium]